jgi:SAM-dependent methyltransferase
MTRVKCVNLGCGSRYHSAWINIDIVPSGPEVIAHDLRRGIPLEADSCDVVYHSHVLEHMRRPEAKKFLSECYRVLKPGGVLRIAVPDLERICRVYLEKLEAAGTSVAAAADYDWMTIELCDQFVREKSGGEMREFLSRQPVPNESFVYERIGEEGREIIHGNAHAEATSARAGKRRLSNSLRYRFGALMRAGARAIVRVMCGEQAARGLDVGSFRLAGEPHQWMYDRFSLARLMHEAGFQNPVQKSATESQIPDWSSFNLDTLPNGAVIKPDSLFMEGTKPPAERARS